MDDISVVFCKDCYSPYFVDAEGVGDCTKCEEEARHDRAEQDWKEELGARMPHDPDVDVSRR